MVEPFCETVDCKKHGRQPEIVKPEWPRKGTPLCERCYEEDNG